MREIEFRGKRKDNGEWIYGWLVNNKNDDYAIELKLSYNLFVIAQKTVGQYIGVYDCTKWEELKRKEKWSWKELGYNEKNWQGKKVYEGDIVEARDILSLSQDKFIAVVAWSDDYCGFCLKEGDYTHSLLGIEDIRVIGNIYDNPELIRRII